MHAKNAYFDRLSGAQHLKAGQNIQHIMLSVNQLATQIKLTEMWKVQNFADYPLRFKQQEAMENKRTTSRATHRKLVETGRTSVVYFDQQMGAPQAVCWSKLTF